MKILMVSQRDIDVRENGTSRTTFLISNYLASTEGTQVFTTYKNITTADKRITEIPLGKLTAENIGGIIRQFDIDALICNEGYLFSSILKQATEGTKCKIVSALHNVPGYDVAPLWSQVIGEIKSQSIRRKITGLIKFLSFPVYKNYRRRQRMKEFQDAYLLSNLFLLLSPSYIEPFRKIYRLKDSSHSQAIGNALSFEQEITSQEFQQKEKTILVVSRLEEQSKRISLILRTWRKIQDEYPEWNLRIVGDGPDAGLYKKMAADMRLERITFEGRKNPELYYTRASIFLMTSAYEGWPMTIGEALQKGCVPVVMDSFSAVYDMITDGKEGFITPNGHLKSFIEKVRFLMDNPMECARMATNGIKSSKRFTIDNIGQKWVDLLKSVINDRIIHTMKILYQNIRVAMLCKFNFLYS